MNLLEKLEAEQAAGWPTSLAPVEPDGLARRRLQYLLALLATVMAEDEQRHQQLHSETSRVNAIRQWANTGQARTR